MWRKQKKEKLKAFDDIVNGLEGPLLRYVTRLISNKTHAQDIVQNTFIKFLRTWEGEYEISKELTAWLYRVAHNEAVDFLRKEARLSKLHSEHGQECLSHNLPPAGPDDKAILAANALSILTPRERELVILKVYEEKSYKEIADITSMSVSNVGATLHGAMKKLAKKLSKSEDDNHDRS